MNKICLHSEETTFITFNYESLKVAIHYSLYCGTFKSEALQWKERAERAREKHVTCCKPISRGAGHPVSRAAPHIKGRSRQEYPPGPKCKLTNKSTTLQSLRRQHSQGIDGRLASAIESRLLGLGNCLEALKQKY